MQTPHTEVNLSDLVRGRPPKRETAESEDRAIAKDQRQAERGEWATKLLASDMWTHLVLPSIEMLYEKYLEEAKRGSTEGMGGVKALEDFMTMLAGYQDLGRRAIHRIAERTLGKENVLPFREKARG